MAHLTLVGNVFAARGDTPELGTIITWIAAIVGIIFALVIVFLVASSFKLWFQAYMSGATIGIGQIIGMRFRRVNAPVIIQSRIMGVKAGLDVPTPRLESLYLAGGNVPNVVRALIAAKNAHLPLDLEMAMAIDLAGRDILDAVQTSVNPKVIDCPDPSKGKTSIDGVAKNGIMVKARARVTVRTNISQLIGGATEETIIARVGEGIVTTIGSAETHKQVLENPNMISKKVVEKGLDAGTAFQILSVDIADVDVGENIGARLQAEQAEADKRVAQAKAEERRAMAVAREQEMQALVRENRAKVVLAESEIPKAISEAFRQGNLGIMDYYNIRNVQSDTRMRESIAGPESSAKQEG